MHGFTEQVHALKICMCQRSLDHGHVQHKSYTVFHSYVPSHCPSILALSCFTSVILHASSVVPVSVNIAMARMI